MRITYIALLKLVDIGFAHKQEPLSCVPQLSNQTHVHTGICPTASYIPCPDSDSIFHHWKAVMVNDNDTKHNLRDMSEKQKKKKNWFDFPSWIVYNRQWIFEFNI